MKQQDTSGNSWKRKSVLLIVAAGCALASVITNIVVWHRLSEMVEHSVETQMKNNGEWIAAMLSELNWSQLERYLLPGAEARQLHKILVRAYHLADADELALLTPEGLYIATSRSDIQPGEWSAWHFLDGDSLEQAAAGQIICTDGIQQGSFYFRTLYQPLVTEPLPVVLVLRVDAMSIAEQLAGIRWMLIIAVVGILAVIGLLAGFAVRAMTHIEEHEREAAFLSELVLVGHMAGRLAHEIRNPLCIMQQTCQRLRRKHDAVEQYRLLEYIEEEIRRVDRLIETFIQPIRQQELRLEPIDLCVEINRHLEHIRQLGISNKVRFETVTSNSVFVLADKDCVAQVIINLAKNAAEAVPEEGTVCVRAYQSGKHGILEMSDTGPGIPQAVIAQLGHPVTSTTHNGLGLGLAICAQIMRRHGGTLTARHQNHATGTIVTASFQGAHHGTYPHR